MQKRLFLGCIFFLSLVNSFSQSVGIGTTTPHTKAVLDIKSTDKGILFPMLTTAQRNAIVNPPHGLHIFNTEERCLNYYDSVFQLWNCYCEACQTVVINITSNACKIDFYNSFAKNSPAKKYLINIAPGVTISGCNPGDTALSFSSMIFNASIIINNRGVIAGAGGSGGQGARTANVIQCFGSATPALNGQDGGSAISTKTGVLAQVNNYGIVAGGGGGGGGGGTIGVGNQYGGGGGGGAGTVSGNGGAAGGIIVYTSVLGIPVCQYQSQNATVGDTGTSTTSGVGGSGGLTGIAGGSGGIRAQVGQNTVNTFGGAAGKSIIGGSGNILVNLSGGQNFGTID